MSLLREAYSLMKAKRIMIATNLKSNGSISAFSKMVCSVMKGLVKGFCPVAEP